MSQHLPDPNQPLTVSVLREALEALEAHGYGDTPISLYATGGDTPRLIQAHNICPDNSIADRPHAPALGFGTTWDATHQGHDTTSFVIL